MRLAVTQYSVPPIFLCCSLSGNWLEQNIPSSTVTLIHTKLFTEELHRDGWRGIRGESVRDISALELVHETLETELRALREVSGEPEGNTKARFAVFSSAFMSNGSRQFLRMPKN